MNTELQKVVDIIVNNFAPDKIILFGSRARGDFNNDSDYDLLVLKEGVKKRKDAWWQIEKSLRGTCIATDIIVETPNHFKELTSNRYMIYSTINQEGKIVYEK